MTGPRDDFVNTRHADDFAGGARDVFADSAPLELTDVGQRGVGVKLIRSQEQAAAYLQQTNAPVVLQRYAPGPHEIGVFYYRFPHESRGPKYFGIEPSSLVSSAKRATG